MEFIFELFLELYLDLYSEAVGLWLSDKKLKKGVKLFLRLACIVVSFAVAGSIIAGIIILTEEAGKVTGIILLAAGGASAILHIALAVAVCARKGRDKKSIQD